MNLFPLLTPLATGEHIIRLTFPDGSALDVEPIGTTSKGALVVDDDPALQIAEAWQDVQGIDEYREWTAPDDDSQPVPYIFGRVAPGSMTRVTFDEWPVIYDPAAGFDGESSAYSLHAFPYELDISEWARAAPTGAAPPSPASRGPEPPRRPAADGAAAG